MRRAIIFLILLVLMCAIAFFIYIAYNIPFVIYTAYNNLGQAADLIDLSSTSRVLDSNGNFSGRFKPNDEILGIKRFTYEVSGDDLYITVYIAKSDDCMETDDDGYTLIEISGLPEIDKVYYANGDSKTVLTTDRE